MGRQLLDALADVGVVVVERGVAKDVRRDVDAQRTELAPSHAEEAGDGGEPGLLVDGPRILRGAELAVGREAYVVELDLGESAAGRLARDGDGVLPDPLANGA